MIDRDTAGNNRGIIIKNEKQILAWVDEGWSAYKIAKELGCGKSSVLRFLNKEGIKTKHKCKVDRNNLLKDKIDQVIQLHREGKSQNEIGKIVGHSGSQICKLLADQNIESRDWKYNVDETFFDTIDTEEKAYILGWFFSDGCVDDQGKMRIQIGEKDKEILEQIKQIMEFNGDLYFVPKRKDHHQNQWCLSISRKRLADKLISWGCVPNKSLILEFPALLDNPHLRHFVRGYLDGDGSITQNLISITSTRMFNTILAEILEKLDIHSKQYDRYEDKCTTSLHIARKESMKKFGNWLYKDSTIYLKRKRAKFEEFLCQS